MTYLAVSPERQGGGIGERLVGSFTQAMRGSGVSAYALSVDENNERAIAFYEKIGFKLIGRYREFGALHCRYRLQTAPR